MDEHRNPIGVVTKSTWMERISDPQNSIAAVTYRPSSDYVELWITKLRPFEEKGFWVTIPGIAMAILELERSKRTASNA